LLIKPRFPSNAF